MNLKKYSLSSSVLAVALGFCACADKAKPDYASCVQLDVKGDIGGAWDACNAAVGAAPTSESGKAAAAKLSEMKPRYDTWKIEQARTAAAEASVRQFGASVFEVSQFKKTDGREINMLGILGYQLCFETDIHWTHDSEPIPTEQQVMAKMGTPGWTVEQGQDDTIQLRILGPGVHHAGTSQHIRGAVLFRKMESGWRFQAMGGPC